MSWSRSAVGALGLRSPPQKESQKLRGSSKSLKEAALCSTSHSPVSARRSIPLEGWRSIYPQQPSFAAPRILPAMRRGTLEIETIPCFETIFFFFELNVQLTAQYVKKLFAFVSI